MIWVGAVTVVLLMKEKGGALYCAYMDRGNPPVALPANHKEASREPQAHDTALRNSGFCFDACLKDEKS